MFSLNCNSQSGKVIALPEVTSTVSLASNVDMEKLERTTRQKVGRLFDPQLYLAGLNSSECPRACGNLGTYPWFGIDAPAFDSGVQRIDDYKRETKPLILSNWTGVRPLDHLEHYCRRAIEFQEMLAVSQIILPAPLMLAREDISVLSEWIEAAESALKDLEVETPALATIAIAERCLIESAFGVSGLLERIADLVTSRETLSGAYVVIAQEQDGHPFETQSQVLKGYMFLSRELKIAGTNNIICNFCDVFGFACVAVGATGFATGQSQSLRRLSIAAFSEKPGGRGVPLPSYYSHRLVSEHRPQADLLKLLDSGKRVLQRVMDDTRFSDDLSTGLLVDVPPHVPGPWVESRSNLAMAQQHFISKIATWANRLGGLSLARQTEEIRSWLEEAESSVDYLENRVRPLSLSGRFADVGLWRQLLVEFLGS